MTKAKSSNAIFDLTANEVARQDETKSFWEALWEPMYMMRDRHARMHVRLLFASRKRLSELVRARESRSRFRMAACCLRSVRSLFCRLVGKKGSMQSVQSRVSADVATNEPHELTTSQLHALFDATPFHYPQRLWMAIVLGGWMQILITFIVVRIFEQLELICVQSERMSLAHLYALAPRLSWTVRSQRT